MDVLLLRDKIAEAGDRYAASLNVDPTDDWIILKTWKRRASLFSRSCATAPAPVLAG
jgi:hypothetical protein